MRINLRPIVALIIIFILFMVFTTFIWASLSQEYITNKITECNDLDGDLIEGLTCYKIIKCSKIFIMYNDEGCEEFLK